MSFSVKSTRAADVTTIAVIHPDGVTELHSTDEEVERDMMPCQVEARRHQREQGSRRPADSPEVVDAVERQLLATSTASPLCPLRPNDPFRTHDTQRERYGDSVIRSSAV
jgi:hypothetical protein